MLLLLIVQSLIFTHAQLLPTLVVRVWTRISVTKVIVTHCARKHCRRQFQNDAQMIAAIMAFVSLLVLPIIVISIGVALLIQLVTLSVNVRWVSFRVHVR